MATTEIEDLAALVGIEILPAVIEPGTVEETKQQAQAAAEFDPSSESVAKEEAGPVFSAEVLELCSSERLSALEEECGERYTQRDPGFSATLATPTHPPPCVSPWWSNDRGDRFRGRGGRGGGGGRGWGRGQGDRRDDRRDHSRDYQQRSHHHHDNRNQGHRDRDGGYGNRDQRSYRDRSPDRTYRY